MSSYTVYRDEPYPSPSPLPQAFLAIAGGMALFVFLIGLVVVVFDYQYAGHIYPGISVAGVDLSGMPPSEAAARLAETLNFPGNGKIVFQDGTHTWVAKPAELGLFLDPETTALAAYSLGRQGNPLLRLYYQFDAWYAGRDLPPLMIFDERMARQYLDNLAVQIDKPVIEASLKVNGVNVVATPGQIGRSLDIDASLAPIEKQVSSLTDGLLPLVVRQTPPGIMDASQQAAIATQILNAPLTLQLPNSQPGDPGPWTIGPDKLAKMLVIERVEAAGGASYQVGLNAEGLRSFLEDLAPKLARNPSDARFNFNEDTRQLQVTEPSVEGRSLDVDATIQAINQKVAQGEHSVPLSLVTTQPQIASDADATKLGIREKVSEETTYFYGSSTSRIQNIKTAASRFNGVMVPPGAVFSMASVMGDVSLDTGYAEALIIYGNRTIKGVGGGVCQVSTTLFRTVFFGGYPIVERHPHAYRVYYYELNAADQDNSRMAGLDATVFVPVVDFKFKNDTPYWLLMETDTNVAARSLTWRFYSTSDGRTVQWDTSGLQNVVDPPEPVYQENPDLEQGVIKQVDWEVQGADVTVNRTVMRDGQVYFQDEIATHYLPWASVFEYGPGTKIPKSQNSN